MTNNPANSEQVLNAAERELLIRATRIRSLEEEVAVLEATNAAAVESVAGANEQAQFWREQFNQLAAVHRAEMELVD